MYELEAHNSRTVSYSKQPAAKAPRLRSPPFLQKGKCSGRRSIRDTGKGANRQSRRTSYSASLTDVDAFVGGHEKLAFLKRCATEGNIGCELPLPTKVDTKEALTMAEKISGFARNHITEWQEWRGKRAENHLKRQQTKPREQPGLLQTNRRNTPSGCSCGPPGCCIFEKLAKEDREIEAAEEAAIAAAEEILKNNHNRCQIVSIFGKTQYLICKKSSKGKNKDSGKGKKVDAAQNGDSDGEHCLSPQYISNDEYEAYPSASRRVAWHPEFQIKPPPSCNCLLFKLGHGFSDGEIQKMRWFLDRIGRGLAVPDDWVEDETQCAAQREGRRWNTLQPLRPQSLEYLAAFLFNEPFKSNLL